MAGASKGDSRTILLNILEKHSRETRKGLIYNVRTIFCNNFVIFVLFLFVEKKLS